jgi:hypothetical protein
MTPRAESERPRPLDARMRMSIAAVAIAGTALTAASLVVFGLSTARSVAVGGAIAAVNLWVLGRVVAGLLPSEAEGARAQSRAGWALVAAVKMLGLVGVVWLLMRHGVVSPLAMLVGLGALPIGIAIGALVSDRSHASEDRP